MPPGKRELARIERQLIVTLTDACETAKDEIKGFIWLTHTADLSALAETLKVIWVFETLADAIDPFPRKPDATFEWQEGDATRSGSGSDSPFAVLANIKTKG